MRYLIIILFFLFSFYSQAEETFKEKAVQKIISESIVSYPGKCACPYNKTSNGSRCGRRSAYSKPGGYEPICFPKDVTDEMISSLDNTYKIKPDFIGKVFVTDGDTIKHGKIRIRFHGIDAPETNQKCFNSNNQIYACGKKSTDFLKSLIKNNTVSCEGKNTDRYGRLIAVCYANEINLNSRMVEEGWAIAYRYYSKDYIGEELNARRLNKGIWDGSFEEPWAWRKKN